MNDFFEKFWLKKAAGALRVPVDTPAETVLEKIRPAVAELSDLFTIERPSDGRFRDYMSEPTLLAAYGLFFFPQSFARADFALRRLYGIYGRAPHDGNELSATRTDEYSERRANGTDANELTDANGTDETGAMDGNGARPLRVLDLGSGAAPCGFAAATILRERFPKRAIELTALDRSRNALDAAREFAEIFAHAADGNAEKSVGKFSFSAVSADLKKFVPAKKSLPPQDLVLLGWSLNEAVPAPGDAVPFLKNLAPLLEKNGAIVVLEPALKITAERLQRASDFFAGKSGRGAPFFRLAPELGEHACPLLRDGVFWNHEVRKWTPPPCAEFLNRKLFRELGTLKFSWCALGKTPPKIFDVPAGASEILRLVSPLETTKTCVRFAGVNPHGEKFDIEMPTRGFSKNAVKKLAASTERGDVVALAGTLSPLGAGAGRFRFSGMLENLS